MSQAWPDGSPQAAAADALTNAGLYVDTNLDGAQLGAPIVWRPELDSGTNTEPFTLTVRAVFELDADIYTELGEALRALAGADGVTWLGWSANYDVVPPEIVINCTTNTIIGRPNST